MLRLLRGALRPPPPPRRPPAGAAPNGVIETHVQIVTVTGGVSDVMKVLITTR